MSPRSWVRQTARAGVGHEAALVGAVERDGPDRRRVARMGDQREAELARQPAADRSVQVAPARPRPIHAAVVLLVERLGLARRRRELVDALAGLGSGSGMKSARTPRLRGSQVAPPSRVSKMPTAEMPTHIRSGSVGWGTIVCRISPPAPGCHVGIVTPYFGFTYDIDGPGPPRQRHQRLRPQLRQDIDRNYLDPTYGWNYELGVKAGLFDGALRRGGGIPDQPDGRRRVGRPVENPDGSLRDYYALIDGTTPRLRARGGRRDQRPMERLLGYTYAYSEETTATRSTPTRRATRSRPPPTTASRASCRTG